MGISLSISSEFETRISSLREGLDALKESKKEGWKEMAMKLIRKARYDTPSLEFKRLQAIGVLDPDAAEKLRQAVKHMVGYTDEESSQALQVMMGQAIEIQKLYSSTHHVFFHAQQSQFLVIPDLLKESMKALHPERNLHQFKCLRMLSETAPVKSIQMYKNPWTHDHQKEAREDLISADAYPYHAEAGESALYFLACNWNVFSGVGEVARSILQRCFPALSSFERHLYASRVQEIAEEDRSTFGNLFVFCIPKEVSPAIQYRAHPFGPVCDCWKSSEDEKILDHLQQGRFEGSDACARIDDPCPQYRLFTPEIRPENGVKVYLVPSNQTCRKAIKEGVRAIVQELACRIEETPQSLEPVDSLSETEAPSWMGRIVGGACGVAFGAAIISMVRNYFASAPSSSSTGSFASSGCG